MRILSILLLSVVYAGAANAQFFKKSKTEETKEEVVLKDQKDSLSYAIGINLATEVIAQEIDSLDSDIIVSAIQARLEGKKQKVSDREAQQYLSSYFMALQEAKAKMIKEAGVKFLEANAKKDGVVALPSGLQYKVLKKGGSGKKPGPSDRVKVHYHGTLVDGSVFDSSVERGRPAQFPVNAVIKGWVEALQLMEVGDKWVLYIPQELAYGARAAGKIPAYSTLIFEVELLEIL